MYFSQNALLMSKIVPEKWIQTKVTIGFIIIIAIAIVIFTISYFSVVSIIKVKNDSGGYEKEFTYLNQLIFEIIETEGISRVYGVTGDHSYEDDYQIHHDSVLSIIAFLPKLFPDTVSINGIKEVKRLYLRKKELMDQLLQINIINLHSSSTENLLSSIPDSLSYEVTEYTYKSLKLDSAQVNGDSISSEIDDQPQKRRGFLKRMSDFLGGKKEKEDSYEEYEPVVSQQVDSTVLKQVREDQNIQKIKKQLKQVSKAERQFSIRLQKHEYDIIKLDRLLTEQIKTIVSNLQEITIKKNNIRRHELETLRSDLIDRILLLVGSAVSLMLFFIYWISRDISKSQKLKNDIIRAKERVDKLLKVKEQFVAHMSHEIRTPLTSIIGFSEQLTEIKNLKARNDISNKIRLSAEHLKGLINNILDSSLLESGKVDFYKDQIHAGKMMEDLFHLFEMRASENGLTLSYQVDEGLEYFESDLLRLKQVLINLIGNAIKFTHEGSVFYSVELKKDRLVFTVKDTGIGVPREKQKTIFKMFNQVNVSLSRKYSGTGLGLSISRQIVEAMGGGIQLTSKDGEGSTFTFHIPYIKGKESISIEKNQKEYNFKEKSILAIDDDEMICQVIDGILHDKCKVLDVNTNPDKAVQALSHRHYDLYMIDLHMPEVDGLQLKNIIRNEKNISTPILFLTADMINAELKRATEEGNIWVMSKPFSKQQIMDKLSEIFYSSIYTEEAVIINEDLNSNKPFSLESVKTFTGDDDEFLKSVVQTFLDNTDSAIQDMKGAITSDTQNLSIVTERAHKLLTGFRQFKIEKGIGILIELENCLNNQLSDKNIEDLLNGLIKLWSKIKIELMQVV